MDETDIKNVQLRHLKSRERYELIDRYEEWFENLSRDLSSIAAAGLCEYVDHIFIASRLENVTIHTIRDGVKFSGFWVKFVNKHTVFCHKFNLL